MKKEKTILFVMSRLPFPATSGRKNSLFHYCRILSEKLGYRLVVAAFFEKGDIASCKPQFIDRLEILPQKAAKYKVFGIVRNSIILKKRPFQVELYWNRKAKEMVNKIVNEEKPKIIIGDMIRCTEYIKDINGYRIADLDDRISLRYQRQLDGDIENINPYGASLNLVPDWMKKILLRRSIKLYILKNEIELLKKYEIDIGKTCDSVFFVAQKEARQFNQDIKEKKAVAVPIGVDIEYFSYQKIKKSENCIGFLGALNVSHNESAVKHFIKNIFPYIIKKCPDAKFLIIGSGGSDELKLLESANVHFTGFVDDVREYLEKCKVFICPMTFGSGIKTKNLEAMAMGLPVVTTSIGAENIDAVDGRDWIVQDDNKLFAESVVKILKNEKLQSVLGENANKFITNNFTWNVTMREMQRALNEEYRYENID